MAFPPSFLEELRTRLSLVSVVGRRVKLTRKGREHTGLCPFHNEKSPSFTVNEDKGFFHCFGCGAHGDVIAFEMRAANLGFTEAVERLAVEAGLEIPRATPEAQARERQRAGLHEALEAACVWFEAQLRRPGGAGGLTYLRQRGLSDATIARFRLGWAPDARDALRGALMSATLPESLLIEAGLLRRPEGGGPAFDYFRGRVIFPITDRRGRVIGFGARTLGEAQPKYLNSPETPVFHKGGVLFGLAHARDAARDGAAVVAVEGYMDVIALHQAGFGAAVAPLGTALTETQLETLWRLAPEPILCLDGDSAGQRAMARALERAFPLLKPGQSLRFALLPAAEDPDSLLRNQGAPAMARVLEQAEPLIAAAWRLETDGRPLDTPERRAGLERALTERANTIADESVRIQYLRAFRDRMWQAFRPPRPARVRGMARPGKPDGALRGEDGRLLGVGRPNGPRPPAEMQERALLGLLLANPLLFDQVHEALGLCQFSQESLDNLRRGILKHLGTGHGLDAGQLSAHLRADGFSAVLEGLLDASERRMLGVRGYDCTEDARALWDDVYHRYTRKNLQADVDEASARLIEEASPASWVRFQAVKRQECTATAGDDEAAADPSASRAG